IFAGDDIDITISIDANDLEEDRYRVNIEFYHNAIARIDTMQIVLDVSNSSVSGDGSNQPLEFNLDQNWPNPFNATTSISYAIEEFTDVKLSIYDISGRLVSSLVDDKQQAGYYRLTFNAADMPNGLYFYRLETQDKIATRKMILMK
ncbi:MAG: T9SS type A sorting domain-containing protein, partial [Calditrichaeota bacterium]|nr:T9SS type A sorting domain-containing protein [Calditrichota bacterium]